MANFAIGTLGLFGDSDRAASLHAVSKSFGFRLAGVDALAQFPTANVLPMHAGRRPRVCPADHSTSLVLAQVMESAGTNTA